MKLHHSAATLIAGAALVLTLSPALAQTYNDPGTPNTSPSGGATAQTFSSTGSDPSTELPYAATAGRPPYAQGGA